ncbi:MAG: hypothetical protein ACREVA_09585 [Burkholderiales bacterium]
MLYVISVRIELADGSLEKHPRSNGCFKRDRRALVNGLFELGVDLVGSQFESHKSVIPAGIAGIQLPRTATAAITYWCSGPRQPLPGDESLRFNMTDY